MKATSGGACCLTETFRQREKTVQLGPTRERAAQIPRLAPAIEMALDDLDPPDCSLSGYEYRPTRPAALRWVRARVPCGQPLLAHVRAARRHIHDDFRVMIGVQVFKRLPVPGRFSAGDRHPLCESRFERSQLARAPRGEQFRDT